MQVGFTLLRKADFILSVKDRARSKTREIFVTVGTLLSCVDGISVSRPAGSRNDARLVEPGKLRQYTRPKGECTAGTIYMWEQHIRYAMQNSKIYRVYMQCLSESWLFIHVFFSIDAISSRQLVSHQLKISNNCFNEIFNYIRLNSNK